MKISLIGYGKMGKAVEQAASEMGVEVIGRLRSTSTEKEWDDAMAADAFIDFSDPKAFFKNLEKIAPSKKAVVTGTTGWHEQFSIAEEIADRFQIGLFYAENFSIGMHLFSKIVQEAAKLVNRFGQYDAALMEIHHREKGDSPSGTALKLAEILLSSIERKKRIQSERMDRKISSDELHVSSLRTGSVPGTHEVVFSSSKDTITLTHQAHDRTLWARGALQAAEWVQGKKGIYTIEDMLA